MTLQSSGAISLNNINTELGVASGTARSLGETSSRNLAGVASGAISLSNFYGKSNVQEIVFDNSAAAWGTPQDWDLWNIFVHMGTAVVSDKVKVVLKNITITASSTGVYALNLGSGWPAGTHLHVYLENCSIIGRGGAGGAGGYKSPGGAGGAGGHAVLALPISGGSVTLELGVGAGLYAGGGGGGGNGGTRTSHAQPQGVPTYSYGTGAAGGQGAGTLGLQTGNGGGYGAAGGYGASGYYGAGAGGAGGASLVNASIVNKLGFASNYWGALIG